MGDGRGRSPGMADSLVELAHMRLHTCGRLHQRYRKRKLGQVFQMPKSEEEPKYQEYIALKKVLVRSSWIS